MPFKKCKKYIFEEHLILMQFMSNIVIMSKKTNTVQVV